MIMVKIAVLVSGGVDSSVALALLKQQGHEVTAFYLKIWLEDELSFLGDCPWQEDLAYVEAVCKQLNVLLHVVSLQKEYHDQVVSYTIAQARAGNTPNPDILCNQRIKFGAFFGKIDASFDKVATGHYAQIKKYDDVFTLHQSPDTVKDQTYFLSHLSQAQLARALFPIGHLTKVQVRALAAEFNLPTKHRKDSQGICFLGKLKFPEFLKYHLGETPGDFVEVETGLKVGAHDGYWFYTNGQRQGIGLAGGPWYVVGKDIHQNLVYISRNYYADDKMRDTFCITNVNWLSGKLEKNDLLVKIRHGLQQYPCKIAWHNDGSAIIKLAERDQGIAPGQFAVLYDGNRCLGGGIIEKTF